MYSKNIKSIKYGIKMDNNFINALADAGIPPHSGNLKLDGKFHHYRVAGDKRRSGWYRYVEVSNDYAWAVFGCWKRGISQKWSNKAGAQVTDYERKERKRQERDIDRKAEEDKTRAAIKATKIWAWLETPLESEYTTRKRVGIFGLKRLNKDLIVPLWIDDFIVSLQFIHPDGEKRFLTGGQSKGAYFIIPGAEDKPVYLCEGYATGASIHMALGCTVVCAFYASNIVPVVAAIRGKIPADKVIYIAADNDQWTEGNPGLSYAQQAAACGPNIMVKVPPFNFEDPARLTDWNDYHCKYGIGALADELEGRNIKPRSEVIIADDRKWRMTLIEGKQELIGYKSFDPKSRENSYLFMENHNDLKGMAIYNVFSGRIILTRCPPWDVVSNFKPRPFENRDYFNLVRALEHFGIRTSKEVVEDVIEALAMQNTINPPRDRLDSIRWNNVPRLNNWLPYYLGAEKQSPDYLGLVGAKWLMGAVSRIYNPGEKFDNVLILEGGQDNKKSMLFKKLATFGEDDYFLEFSGDVTNKDSLGAMQGKIIVEMSELASMRRAHIEEMKTFITREVDTFRPAWGRTILERKRQFVLAATTNNNAEDGYLIDPTGNRRYWPVGCGEFDMEALIRDRDQLWAEAVHRWKAGEKTWLDSKEEKELAKFEQSERQHEDTWLQPIEFYLVGKMETDVYRVCREGIGLSGDQIKKATEDRARQCLKKLGWVRSGRERTEKGRITIWTKK